MLPDRNFRVRDPVNEARAFLPMGSDPCMCTLIPLGLPCIPTYLIELSADLSAIHQFMVYRLLYKLIYCTYAYMHTCREMCGIIARSAGLFQNTKKVCTCDGVTIWEEAEKAKTRTKAAL